MKAVRFSRFGGPEVLEIVDLPDPHPGPGQVRIAVRAAGVNPGDWKKPEGLVDPGLPQAMGHEAAGIVDELGEGVADVAVGDAVFGFTAAEAAQAEPPARGGGGRGRAAGHVRRLAQEAAPGGPADAGGTGRGGGPERTLAELQRDIRVRAQRIGEGDPVIAVRDVSVCDQDR